MQSVGNIPQSLASSVTDSNRPCQNHVWHLSFLGKLKQLIKSLHWTCNSNHDNHGNKHTSWECTSALWTEDTSSDGFCQYTQDSCKDECYRQRACTFVTTLNFHNTQMTMIHCLWPEPVGLKVNTEVINTYQHTTNQTTAGGHNTHWLLCEEYMYILLS